MFDKELTLEEFVVFVGTIVASESRRIEAVRNMRFTEESFFVIIKKSCNELWV